MIFKCIRDYQSKYGFIASGSLCLLVFNDDDDFYLVHGNRFYLSEDELDEYFRRIYWTLVMNKLKNKWEDDWNGLQ